MLRRRDFLTTAASAAAIPPLGLGLAPIARAQEGPLRMRDLYEKTGDFSKLAKSLEGQRVTVRGFMAPPLKADSRFFVLTKRPMAVCPFCEDEAEWPEDILAIYTKRVLDVVPFNVGIETTGVLRLGGYTDFETGFVSRVRLEDATYARG